MASKGRGRPKGSKEQSDNIVEEVKTAGTKEAESARERFLRLAPPRTESAIKRIKLLANLASSSYQYERAEANQIVEALFDAVHDLKRRFEKKAKDKTQFTFRGKKEAAE
jgi:hypothetical protein